ncbi:MAG TPA: zf-HC2 domain-containing protein [Polyangiaceae bacterium]|jgi:anti-sigma factor RsiW|nr:zf-HC2 domain-containing protein [Polyangiaceae bacterium]
MTVRGPATLVCKEVVELVTEYLDQAMSPEERARIEQHLLVCPPCTLHVAQVRATIARLAELRAKPDAEAGKAMVDLFRQWKKRGAGDEGA